MLGSANLLYLLIWVVAAVVAVAVLWLRRALPALRNLVRPGAVSIGVAGVVLIPIARIYLAVDERNGLERGYEPAGSLLPTDFLTPHRGNWSWGTALDGINSVGKAGEHWFFLGFSVIALGTLGFVLLLTQMRRTNTPTQNQVRIDEIVALSAAAITALVLAIGPTPGGVPGPFRVVHRFVPGFDGVRVTSRFTVIAFVALGALVALAYQHLADRSASRWRWLAAPGLVLVILLEVGGPAGRVIVPEGERLAAYELLDELPEGAVLELPIRVPADGAVWPFVEAPRMFHSLTDGNTRVNGYSGGTPAGFDHAATTFRLWPAAPAERLADRLASPTSSSMGASSRGHQPRPRHLDRLGEQAEAAGHRTCGWEDLLVIVTDPVAAAATNAIETFQIRRRRSNAMRSPKAIVLITAMLGAGLAAAGPSVAATTYAPQWSTTFDGWNRSSSPAIADIDGDGEN